MLREKRRGCEKKKKFFFSSSKKWFFFLLARVRACARVRIDANFHSTVAFAGPVASRAIRLFGNRAKREKEKKKKKKKRTKKPLCACPLSEATARPLRGDAKKSKMQDAR
jgi:hypothetical protein